MKIRVKRIKRGKYYESNLLDVQFRNGTIPHIPKIGESMVVQFDRLGWGSWHTTPVVSREATKTVVVLKTKNSTYHLKYGWEE